MKSHGETRAGSSPAGVEIFLFFNYNIKFYYIKLISINYYQKYNNRTLLYKLSFAKLFVNIIDKANRATNSYIFIPLLRKKQINE